MASWQLDPDAISRGEALGILARRIVEGYRVGEHRSPYHGFAIEFAQHREYTPGDDPKHLDWKLLGKTDRHYIKQYEQDTNFVATLLLDSSSSMSFGSGETSKFDHARILAACLAHIILAQRDAAALAVFDSDVHSKMRRTDNPRRMSELLQRLASAAPSGNTNLGRALEDVATSASRRGIVFLFSDVFGNEEDLAKGLERLAFQGSEVVVFHVLDPQELTFSINGRIRFEGLEGEEPVLTDPAAIRKSYLENFGRFLRRIREICEKSGAHYVLADTSVPVGETLVGYLSFRNRAAAR